MTKPKDRQQPKQRSSSVALVAQGHGGFLKSGGNPGNKGGTGRPPTILRDRLEGSFSDRVGVLEAIADGEPVEHFEASFLSILPHVKCPHCESPMEAGDPAAAAMLSIPAKRSARPVDRIKAIDTIGKYGPGTKVELTTVSPDVQARIQSMIALISSQPRWESAILLDRLGTEVWR